MILSSGLNYGITRSLPHLFGISVGFAFMVFATGLGLHTIFIQYPKLQMLLKVTACGYLTWLAYQLANAKPKGEGEVQKQKPMTFFGAAAFQWVNPKAWVMALGALAAYLPNASKLMDIALLAVIYGVVCLPCVGIWSAFGTSLGKVLKDHKKIRIFNRIVAGVLLLSLYPMIFE